MYALVKKALVGSDKGLLPVHQQAIIYASDCMLLIGFGDYTDLLWWNNINN